MLACSRGNGPLPGTLRNGAGWAAATRETTSQAWEPKHAMLRSLLGPLASGVLQSHPLRSQANRTQPVTHPLPTSAARRIPRPFTLLSVGRWASPSRRGVACYAQPAFEHEIHPPLEETTPNFTHTLCCTELPSIHHMSQCGHSFCILCQTSYIPVNI